MSKKSISKGQQVLERLNQGEIILGDGAPYIIPVSGGSAQHNIGRERELKKMHIDYRDAGSRLSFANTLSGSPHALSRLSTIPEKIEEINNIGLEAARASGNPVVGLVLADYVGLVGDPELLTSDYTHPDEARKSYERQISILVEGGADIIYLLTHQSIEEAKVALEVATEIVKSNEKKTNIKIPIALAFTFGAKKDEPHNLTYFGCQLEQVVNEFAEKVDIIGTNCNYPGHVEKIVRDFRKLLADKPLIIQPGAGEAKLGRSTKKTIYPINPEQFAKYIPGILSANNGKGMIFAGCCGVTPDYIKAVKATLDSTLKH